MSGAEGGGATGPPAGPSAGPPALETRRLRLRAVEPDDHPFLYDLLTGSELNWRFQYRGYVPSRDQFVRDLGRDTLIAFLVDDKKQHARCGLVHAYSANMHDRHSYVSVAMTPRYQNTGLGMEAMVFFVYYLFTVWDFRKLYFEMIGFNEPRVRSGGGRSFVVEGVLKEHHFYDGRYWDKYLLAVYRDPWMEAARPGIEKLRIAPPGPEPQPFGQQLFGRMG